VRGARTADVIGDIQTCAALQERFARDVVGADDRVATLCFGEGVSCGYPTQYNCYQANMRVHIELTPRAHTGGRRFER
jgi:hypothetical protein